MSVFYDPYLSFCALAVILFCSGALVGSFCAKMVYRLAGNRFSGLSFFSASFCPSCGKKLKFKDKIPILSFFLLRGKCRNCYAKISLRYLVFEVLGALLPFFFLWFDNFSVQSLIDYFFVMILLVDLFTAYDTQTLPIFNSFLIIVLKIIFCFFYSTFISDILIGAGVGLVFSALLSFICRLRSKRECIFFGTALGIYFEFPAIVAYFFLVIAFIGIIAILHALDNRVENRFELEICLSTLFFSFFTTTITLLVYSLIDFIVR